MLDQQTIERLAQRLDEAERSKIADPRVHARITPS